MGNDLAWEIKKAIAEYQQTEKFKRESQEIQKKIPEAPVIHIKEKKEDDNNNKV